MLTKDIYLVYNIYYFSIANKQLSYIESRYLVLRNKQTNSGPRSVPRASSSPRQRRHDAVIGSVRGSGGRCVAVTFRTGARVERMRCSAFCLSSGTGAFTSGTCYA